MKLLGVETSSPVFSVAVCDGDRILSSFQSEDPSRRSDFLSEFIQRAIQEAGLTPAQLDGFAISIGPGSFTGLRVGVMTIKTLAWALKKPILPVSSLEVTAHNFSDGSAPIGLFLDARKGKVYSALFSPEGAGRLKRLAPDRLLPPEEALKKFPGGTVVVGDGIRRYQDLLRTEKGKELILPPESLWIPSAKILCRIAAARWPRTSTGGSAGLVDDPHRLVPQYLYSKESDITGW